MMGRTNAYYMGAYGIGWAFKIRPVTQISSQILPAVTGTLIARAVYERHEQRGLAFAPTIESRDGVPTVVLARKF